ncbi:hypothetical protein D1872_252620 [compost metagenome]
MRLLSQSEMGISAYVVLVVMGQSTSGLCHSWNSRGQDWDPLSRIPMNSFLQDCMITAKAISAMVTRRGLRLAATERHRWAFMSWISVRSEQIRLRSPSLLCQVSLMHCKYGRVYLVKRAARCWPMSSIKRNHAGTCIRRRHMCCPSRCGELRRSASYCRRRSISRDSPSSQSIGLLRAIRQPLVITSMAIPLQSQVILLRA